MTARERLSSAQLAIMRSLFIRGGHGIPISLNYRWRFAIPELWRRELLQIWHRTSPGRGSEGPYYSLTHSGRHLAAALFNRAPRRFSGAEQSS
jgi:hypothetical protein